MGKPKLRIVIEGDEAAAAADVLHAALPLESGSDVTRTWLEPEPDAQHKGIDPALLVAVASLLVSIPSAVLASLQVQEHLRKERAEKLRRAALEAVEKHRVSIKLITIDEQVALDTLETDELLQLAAQLHENG